MRGLRNSIEGVEGIPFKLIIVAVVLAITLPVAFDRFNHWDADRTETYLKMEIQGLISRVKEESPLPSWSTSGLIQPF